MFFERDKGTKIDSAQEPQTWSFLPPADYIPHLIEPTKEQGEQLTQAMVDFSIRVLRGQNCTMQETASLPAVLSILLKR